VSNPSAGERQFIDRLGLFFEMLGAPRTMGRIYGWLMISDPDHQSITEIAKALGVSKASISTLIRQLEASQVVERVPLSDTRQHHYRATEGGWAQIEIQPIDVACTLPEPALVQYLTRLGPVGTALQAADDTTRARVVDAVRPAFDPFVHGTEVRFTAACWMIGARAR